MFHTPAQSLNVVKLVSDRLDVIFCDDVVAIGLRA